MKSKGGADMDEKHFISSVTISDPNGGPAHRYHVGQKCSARITLDGPQGVIDERSISWHVGEITVVGAEGGVLGIGIRDKANRPRLLFVNVVATVSYAYQSDFPNYEEEA